MTRAFTYYIVILFSVTSIVSRTENNGTKKMNSSCADSLTQSSVFPTFKNIVVLKESHNQDDIILNKYLAVRLKPIRKNFKRINSITKWTSTSKKELSETTDFGDVTFYYSNLGLEKIVTQQFGETFQHLSEYYLLNGKLSFVFEKSYKYNRPMYYDTTAMNENNDTEAFEFEKSEIIEDRSYFEKGKLIHQISNQDSGSPFTEEYLFEEQKRIMAYFDKLIKRDSK